MIEFSESPEESAVLSMPSSSDVVRQEIVLIDPADLPHLATVTVTGHGILQDGRYWLEYDVSVPDERESEANAN